MTLFEDGDATWYADADGDGWGDMSTASVCVRPDTSWEDDTDCDDTDPTVYPTAPARCDGLANDCVALEADERDDDSDGYVACTQGVYVVDDDGSNRTVLLRDDYRQLDEWAHDDSFILYWTTGGGPWKLDASGTGVWTDVITASTFEHKLAVRHCL